MEYQIGSRFWRFHGGLKLRHYKKMAIADTVPFAGVPDVLRIPIDQHQGAAAERLVEVGESVVAGQAIAASEQVTLHAPWAGTIAAIDSSTMTGRRHRMTCIDIKTAANSREEQRLEPWPDWPKRSATELAQRAREGGVVGLGGALFPTAIKLESDTEIDTLLVNGAECEPYIACDEMLMRTRANALVRGSSIAARALGGARAIIAIEDQMGAVEALLQQAVDDAGDDVTVIKVPTIYPEGGEKQLIQVLTGKEVPSGGLPKDLGIVVINVSTAAALFDAVVEGRPVTRRMVTVTGRGVVAPATLEALIGTPASFLVERAGGYAPDVSRLVMGGPMMGIAMPDDAAGVTKASNCLLALTEQDIAPSAPELPCIRCMECVRVCPAQLLPQLLMLEIKAGQYANAAGLALADCIECGCCAQVCPSQIPLVDYYRDAKTQVRILADQERKAEHHRLRFEARNERLKQEAARDAEALARKSDQLRPGNRQDAIKAALERAKKKKPS